MQARSKKLLCLVLVSAILLTAVSFLAAGRVEALDYTDIKTKLSTWQYYFCRTFMSLALKDYIDTGVLPSVTVGQALYEGGCAGHPISIIGKNHYGIKAYPASWSGKIYDDKEHTLYNSYIDLSNIKGAEYAKHASIWRAYDTWEEGVKGHSDLFYEEEKYKPVLAAADYREASYAIMNAGYAGSSSTYADNLIGFIEKYGFAQLDEVVADEHGIFGIVMSQAEAEMESGDTLTLTTEAFPTADYDYRSEVVWTSDNPTVATVDQNGVVTAKAMGYTLITADYGDKEACCVVSVDCNAFVMSASISLYSEPDTDSDSMGKLVIGQPVHVNSTTLFEGEDGKSFYAVTARNSSGRLVSGFAVANNVYIGTDVQISVETPLTILYLEEGVQHTIPLEVRSPELLDKEISWRSSDASVATVDQNGVVTPLSEGVTIISVLLDGRVALTITVYVGMAGYEDIVATAAVYIRSGCDAAYTILGTIKKGQTVKLITDLGDGWYKVLANLSGEFVIGYSYSRYFRFPWEEESSEEPSSEPSREPSSEPSSEPSYEPSREPSREPSSEPESSEPQESSEIAPRIVTVTVPVGEVRVDTSLQVRRTPGTDGKALVQIPNRTEVLILEVVTLEHEKTYKEWYRISFTFNRKDYEGYACADFILKTGTRDIEVEDLPNPSKQYEVTEEYVLNILPDTDRASFEQELGRTVSVIRADSADQNAETEVLSDDLIRTGDLVTFFIGSFPVYSRLAVVRGDASPDGRINISDYLVTKAHILNTRTLNAAEYRAASVSGNEPLSAIDYFIIKSIVLGIRQDD